MYTKLRNIIKKMLHSVATKLIKKKHFIRELNEKNYLNLIKWAFSLFAYAVHLFCFPILNSCLFFSETKR